jgi:hypothetical protein
MRQLHTNKVGSPLVGIPEAESCCRTDMQGEMPTPPGMGKEGAERKRGSREKKRSHLVVGGRCR